MGTRDRLSAKRDRENTGHNNCAALGRMIVFIAFMPSLKYSQRVGTYRVTGVLDASCCACSMLPTLRSTCCKGVAAHSALLQHIYYAHYSSHIRKRQDVPQHRYKVARSSPSCLHNCVLQGPPACPTANAVRVLVPLQFIYLIWICVASSRKHRAP